MATIDELIASIEVEREAEEKREAKARAEIKLQIETAQREGRSNLTAEEDQRAEELFAQIEKSREAQDGIKQKLARATKVKADEAEAEARSREVRDTGVKLPKYDEVARVGREERTYNPESDPGGGIFLKDVCRNFLGVDPAATQRLARHMQEERVERAQYLERAAGDAVSSVFGGLVVPQYLVDLTAPAVAAMRPLADMCVKHPLPATGMTINVPAITTATSAALQATQLTAVSGTSIADTDVSLTVQTAAGFQNVSRQAIDRGVGIESTVVGDLMNRYNTALDSTLINQATTGLSAKALGTLGAFAATQPTGALLYPKILAAASGVEAVCLNMATPTNAVMHSRRWYWLAKEMTTSWPLINFTNIPTQAGGVGYPFSAYGSGARGVLPNGLVVIVDNSVPTNVSANQDEIYIVPQSECHLWELPGQPAFIRAEQPNAASLGVLLVVYGYFAYTFDRYGSGSMQKVGGAGLTTPAF